MLSQNNRQGQYALVAIMINVAKVIGQQHQGYQGAERQRNPDLTRLKIDFAGDNVKAKGLEVGILQRTIAEVVKMVR